MIADARRLSHRATEETAPTNPERWAREGSRGADVCETSFLRESHAEISPLSDWVHSRPRELGGVPTRSVRPVELRRNPEEGGVHLAGVADAPREEDELVEVGDGGPALLHGPECGLIVDEMKIRMRRPRIRSLKVHKPRMTPQTSRGLI